MWGGSIEFRHRCVGDRFISYSRSAARHGVVLAKRVDRVLQDPYYG